MNSMFLTDGYKLDHRNQYPKGTEFIQSNWTPRSSKHFGVDVGGVNVFGITYVFKYIIEHFNKHFFSMPVESVVGEYKEMVEGYLGTEFDVKHLYELYEYGRLPIEVRGLVEGVECPIGMPCLTIVNTDARFFWVVNYLETLISNLLWMPMTSATIAKVYKDNLVAHFEKTLCYVPEYANFCCHDFSMRGMSGLDATIGSGMGHLFVWGGSESIPAILAMRKYYGGCVAGTVPATEHSVMCAGGKDTEFDTYRRLLTEVYPSGFVSIVSDTWDLWGVVTGHIPALKEEILKRDGRFVVRPDSGDPVKIICGDNDADKDSPAYKGVYELLWEVFGGDVVNGYKVLDTHIGVIYGDSITIERQKSIYKGLEEKGFSATNLVLGIGSYTYQYVTRDTFGFAMKSTWCQIDGVGRKIFKDPITDDGTKKSAVGWLDVCRGEDGKRLVLMESEGRVDYGKDSAYVTYVKDGRFVR